MLTHNPLPIIVDRLFALNDCNDPQIKARALQDSQEYVAELRKSYNSIPCSVDYTNPNLRAAYMLAYFPHYIEPVHHVLEELPRDMIAPLLSGNSVNICAFGSGPAPELLGAASFIREHFPQVKQLNCSLMDANNLHWQNCLDISLNALAPNYWQGGLNVMQIECNLLTQCSECNAKHSCGKISREADIYIVQNCLNDVCKDPASITNKLLRILKKAKPGAIFIVLDLNFKKLKDIMKWLQDTAMILGIGNMISPVTDDYKTCKSGIEIPANLREYLFTGDDGLIAKLYTRYYCTVIQRA